MEPSEPDAGVLICQQPRYFAWLTLGLLSVCGWMPLAFLLDPKSRAEPMVWLTSLGTAGCMIGGAAFVALRAGRVRTIADKSGLTLIREFERRFIPWESITDYFQYAGSANFALYVVDDSDINRVRAYGNEEALQKFIEREAKWAKVSHFEIRDFSLPPNFTPPEKLEYQKKRAEWWRNLVLMPLAVAGLMSLFVWLYLAFGPQAFDLPARQVLGLLLIATLALAIVWLRYKRLVWRQLQVHRNDTFSVSEDGLMYEHAGRQRSIKWYEVQHLAKGAIQNSPFVTYWRLGTPDGAVEFTNQLERAEGLALYIASQVRDAQSERSLTWELDDETWRRHYGVYRGSSHDDPIEVTARNFVNRMWLLLLIAESSLILGLQTGDSFVKGTLPEVWPFFIFPPSSPLIILFGWFLMRRLKVVIGPDGLTRHGLVGSKFMPWAEIEEYGPSTIHGHGRQFYWSVTMGDQQAVKELLLREIRNHAPQAKVRLNLSKTKIS